jgi:hypothetical protein
MPAQPFTVRVDPDDLARQNLAAAVSLPSVADQGAERPASAPGEHHGARDGRAAARERSGRDRSGRAASAGSGGRSYAFRRS